MASLAGALPNCGPIAISEQDHDVIAEAATTSATGLLSSRELTGYSPSVRVLYSARGQTEEDAAWGTKIARRLEEILTLPPNWDSYGAAPIDFGCAQAAIGLLLRIASMETPVPAIVPTVRGGVQLEWHTDFVDLEITYDSPFHAEVFFQDHERGEQWEGVLANVMTRLPRVMGRLSA